IDAPLLGRIPRLAQPGAEAAAAHIDFTGLPNWPTRNKL
ncbi:MAG: dethiobiotin synthase, partial [Duganella sp.]